MTLSSPEPPVRTTLERSARARFEPPRTSRDLISRPRLTERLEHGLTRGPTLVSAPVGFGKTTLLAAWAHERAQPVAWLSLDERDNRPDVFVADLMRSIEVRFPDACRSVTRLLDEQHAPAPVPIARLLGDTIERLPEPLTIVLDDYHQITNRDVHRLVWTLAQRGSGRLQTVIASRIDPPLPLEQPRRDGQLNEIRAADLRFREHETREFLGRALESEPPARVIALLHARTEGWIAALRLATLSLDDRPDSASFAEQLGESNRHIMDLLGEQVLLRATPALREFLVKTSIVDRICASLCDALLAGDATVTAPPALLAEAARANLFVEPLGDHDGWYQYHGLLRTMLRHSLVTTSTDEQLIELHRRASGWFADQGMLDESFDVLITIDDREGAARLCEQQTHTMLDGLEQARLYDWLRRLPDSTIRARPALLMAHAWTVLDRTEPASLLSLMGETGALIARMTEQRSAPPRDLHGEIAAVRAFALFAQGDVALGLGHAVSAAARIPTRHAYARGLADRVLGMSLRMTGQEARAERYLEEALTDDAPESLARVSAALAGLAHNAMADACYDDVEALAGAMHRRRSGHPAGRRIGWDQYLSGCVNYERGLLESAAEHFAATGLGDGGRDRIWLNSALGLALTQGALGCYADAEALLDDLTRAATGVVRLQDLDLIRSLRARLALMRGDTDSAERWLRLVNVETLPPSLATDLEIPGQTEAWLLFTLGHERDLRLARDRLEALASVQTARRDNNLLVRTLALRALVLDALGDSRAARAAIRRAVVLAAPGRMCRSIAELGPVITPLLSELVRDPSLSNDANRLLQAFPCDVVQVPTDEHSSRRSDLVDWPTRREVEVLAMLAARLTNLEIAQKLGISPSTVRGHTVNLFQKLQVNGRREAVERARVLGLLPASVESV
jgi:LuxR family maltose regulon positive regulatory protein